MNIKSFLFLGFAWLAGGCTADGEVASSQEAVHACGTLADGGTRWCADEGWDGGYHCVDNSCHEAANGGVTERKGILSCDGFYTGPYGHTINWDVPVEGTLCIEEPQSPGEGPAERQTCNGTTLRACIDVIGCRWTSSRSRGSCSGTPTNPAVSGGTCCWSGMVNADGIPDLTTPAAMSCISLLCPAPTEGAGPPVAHPPGHVWDTSYTDCAGNNPDDRDACVACCEANADAVPDDWGVPLTCQREEYRNRCRMTCGAGPSPTPRLPCECITDRQQCLDARCGWYTDGSGCTTTPRTPPLPPVPTADAGTTADAGMPPSPVDAAVVIEDTGTGSETGVDAAIVIEDTGTESETGVDASIVIEDTGTESETGVDAAIADAGTPLVTGADAALGDSFAR